MLITTVRQARTIARPDGCDLHIREGSVSHVLPPGAAVAEPGGTYDAGGRVVLPAFVDAHVHLDKAYLRHQDSAPTHLGEVLAQMASLREVTSAATTRQLAENAVSALVRNGTTAARAQVEVSPVVGLDLLRMHQRLADDNHDRLMLQLVAFPQGGLEAAGMPQLMEAALREGAQVVGACPYVDSDPLAHLDLVFSLAERFQLPLDLHLDFFDDPGSSLAAAVAQRTDAHGMAGLVTVGHVTTLAAMSPDRQAETLSTLADSGISLVVMPATDLFLTGHGEPGSRSMAPYERAVAAGVRTAIANNNIGNTFAPFGNASLLQAAWLAGLLRRAASTRDAATLLHAITRAPAGILGLRSHGTEVDELADLVIVQDDTPDQVLLRAPAVAASLRRGLLVAPWTPRPVH